MRTHYDIRLRCRETGELEATEDIGYPTREAAQKVVDEILGDRYVVVECRMRGSHEVHDVDLSYYRHCHDHLGETGRVFERISGAPTDEMVAPR